MKKRTMIWAICMAMICTAISSSCSPPQAATTTTTTETTTTTAPTTTTTTTQATTPAPTAPPALSRGVVTRNVYFSDTIELTFKVPYNWEIATDEFIAAAMEIGSELLGQAGMPMTKELMDMLIIFDLMAISLKTGSSVTLFYQNLNLILGGTKLDAKGYLDYIRDQATQNYDTHGITLDGLYSSHTIGGHEYLGAKGTTVDTDTSLLYLARRFDKYALVIQIIVMPDDDLDDILVCFS